MIIQMLIEIVITNVTKSIIFKNVTRPDDAPYLYKNSNMNGITTKYANRQPETKDP